MNFPNLFKIFLLLIIFLSSSFAEYKLVWSDEFDGYALNLEKWSYDIGDSWYNNEVEAYNHDNVYVKDGYLKIQARQEVFGSKNYTSGRIKTQNKHFWTYGKFEAKIKMPTGQGFWPAFWMYVEVENDIYKEITIMESFNKEKNQTLSACWYGGPGEDPFNFQAFYNLPEDGFHTYGAEWKPGQIDFFVDNNPFFSCYANNTEGNWSLDNVSFHLLLNMAVGGNRPGNPDETTAFPADMLVDWVRVYQNIEEHNFNPDNRNSIDMFNNTNYELIWSDEFNGYALNLEKWSYDIGDSWYNEEVEAYNHDNVYVKDGYLKIQARKEVFGSKNYTSGRIKTQNKHFWTYGIFTARIKMPAGQGFWPAFWMYVEEENEIYKEVTIMESFNKEKNQTLSACWYGGPGENPFNFQAFYNLSEDGFHTYSAEWKQGQIDFFVDNNQFFSCYANETNGNWSLDNVSFHLLLNMAVGGNRPGNPDETTTFPADMLVDWVRVYRKKDDNSSNKKFLKKDEDGNI